MANNASVESTKSYLFVRFVTKTTTYLHMDGVGTLYSWRPCESITSCRIDRQIFQWCICKCEKKTKVNSQYGFEAASKGKVDKLQDEQQQGDIEDRDNTRVYINH